MLGGTTILSNLAVPLGVAAFLIPLARYLRSRDSLTKSKFPYPPGPKGLPLIGNLLNLPRDIPVWEGFSQMAEAYGTQVVPTIRPRTQVLMTDRSHRDGYPLPQRIWNSYGGSEFERDHRGSIGQEVSNIFGQGSPRVPRLFGRGLT